jgi:hypothetical protein
MSGAAFFERIDPARAMTTRLSDALADCLDELDPHPAITLNVLAALLVERLERLPPELRGAVALAVTDTIHDNIRKGLA